MQVLIRYRYYAVCFHRFHYCFHCLHCFIFQYSYYCFENLEPDNRLYYQVLVKDCTFSIIFIFIIYCQCFCVWCVFVVFIGKQFLKKFCFNYFCSNKTNLYYYCSLIIKLQIHKIFATNHSPLLYYSVRG